MRLTAVGVDDHVGTVGAVTFSIGQFGLSAPVVLAPMAGVTNMPFRALCRQFAPGLVYVNEMVMATPVVHGNTKTHSMITFGDDEHPRSLQLYGSFVMIFIFLLQLLGNRE